MLILMINFLSRTCLWRFSKSVWNQGDKGIISNFVQVHLLQESYIFANGTTLIRYPEKNIDLLSKTAFCSSKFQFLKLCPRKCAIPNYFCKIKSKNEMVILYCTSNFSPSEAKFPTVHIPRASVRRITVKCRNEAWESWDLYLSAVS